MIITKLNQKGTFYWCIILILIENFVTSNFRIFLKKLAL